MSRTLRVLNIEDSRRDAELLRFHLEGAGFDVVLDRVDTSDAMKAALGAGTWDVIIADYFLPQFGAIQALSLLKAGGLDLPFIVISGNIGEELAVTAIRAGAHDYVTKGNLARLVPAIERELVACTNRTARREAEEVLKSSAAELRAIVSAMTDLTVVFDSDGRFVNIERNDPAYRSRADYLMGKVVHEVYPREKADFILAHIRQALRERQTHRLEYTMERDGKVLWYEGTVSAMSESAVVWIAHDITERKRSEQALRDSEERFRLIAETITQVFWIADLNIEQIVYVSPAYERLWSRSCESLYQDPRSFADAIHPDDLQRVMEGLEAQKAGLPFDHEYRIVRPGGEVRWIWDRGYPVREESGPVRYFVGVAQDVTERIATDARMRLLARAIESTNEMVSVTDVDNRFNFVNGAFLRTYGYAIEEVLGRTPEFLHLHDRSAELGEILERTRRGGWQGELTNRRKDGTELVVSLNTSPIRDPQGAIIGLLSVARDITGRLRAERALHEAEDQLRQSQKMEAIGHLSGGIAHDFNNMLTVINGYSELGLSQLTATSPLRRNFEGITEAGLRAAGLTRQLLTFSRKQVLQPRVFDLNIVVSELEKMLHRLIGEDIDLRTNLDKDLGTIKADPGQVEQVIMNLSVNSRDAMPKGGKLSIETSNVELGEEFTKQHPGGPPGPYVMLTVSDTGTGMDAETQARLFEPFFTTKQLGRGTGLGLSTVYGIVQQAGGTIWVCSELGRGTTFKVYFPRVIDSAYSNRQQAKEKQDLKGSETILLTEDENMVRALTCIVLKRYGYRVIEAENGARAISVCEQEKERIHLLITDIIMPEMRGPDLADQVVRLRPGVKVLYMSGYTDNTIIHQAILNGSAPFIQKPFTPEALAVKIREVLDTKD